MARVTVEDCVLKVPNRFELVVVAAQRARDISAGSQLTVDRDRDKNPVVALREIADSTVEVPVIREAVVRGLQKHAETEDTAEESESYAGEVMMPGETGPIAIRASVEEEPVGDELDLEALARDLRAEAAGFRNRDDD